MNSGWQIKKLEELCSLFDDGDWIESKDQSDSGIRLIQTGNVGVGQFKDRAEKARYVSKDTFTRLKCTEIVEGDCLVSRLPDPVGRACIIPDVGEKMITAVDCTIIRFNRDKISPVFFNYYAQSLSYLNSVESLITGATRQRISRSNLGQVSIPLPPLSEQQRIVAVLDEAFAGIAKAAENSQKNLANARELFESHLQSIFTTKCDGWMEKSIQDISKIVNGYAFASEDFKPTNTIKSIKITNVGVKEFVEETGNYLPKEYEQTHKEFQVREGNIVIALTRTIIAAGLKVAVVPHSYHGALVNQRVAALIPNEKLVTQRFLYNFLTTLDVSKYVLAHVNTLMQPNLSINDLKKLPVPLPPLSEQQRIVAQLDAIASETKRLEAIYQQKLDNLAALKQSILQKAFAGELSTDRLAA